MKNNEFQITEFGQYLNHSYYPNAATKVIDGIYKTYAIKDIELDDEITLNYENRKELEQPEKWWK
ncbi:MAG: SET domain-containing protein-lysine N-methyltransferase [Patescibacteria group bacterium]